MSSFSSFSTSFFAELKFKFLQFNRIRFHKTFFFVLDLLSGISFYKVQNIKFRFSRKSYEFHAEDKYITLSVKLTTNSLTQFISGCTKKGFKRERKNHKYRTILLPIFFKEVIPFYYIFLQLNPQP